MRTAPHGAAAGLLADAEIVVAGAGLFGLTVAERAASELGARVAVVECRDHIGGNAFSRPDADTGIEVHPYGTHVFHTSNQKVWDYVRRFADFNDYRHHVIAVHEDRAYPMPISLATMSTFFGRVLTPDEARAIIASHQSDVANARTLEAKALASVGRPLYEAFIRGYTTKQWGMPPADLPASIIARLPVRLTFDTRYFSDAFEGIPRKGYGHLARSLASAPGITVLLDTDFRDVRRFVGPQALVIYTGPIDAYFDHAHGRLSWRTLRFEEEVLPIADFQGTAVVNYVDEHVPFTRVHEFRHLDPDRTDVADDWTVIHREFSVPVTAGAEPYYPVGTPSDRRLLKTYQAMARGETAVLFGGRLGSYAYLDMDMAIASALALFEESVRAWWATRGEAHR